MASPVFFIKKKNSSLCLVQYYWKLNTMTVKNSYPLPLIPDILNSMSKAKAKYFTKLSDRDSTTYRCGREMNGKWLFRQTEAFSNLLSCSLALSRTGFQL